MARKTARTKTGPATNLNVAMPTMIRTRLPGGLCLAVDGSVWLYRKISLEPVADAKTVAERMNVYTPLLAAYEELAAMTPVTVTRRAMARNSYRQHQLFMVNLRRLYQPSPDNPLAGFLKSSFPNYETEKRIVLFGVRLRDKIGGKGGMKEIVDSVVETLVSGSTPLSDFDDDRDKVHAALERCGFSVPTAEEMALANSWWNQGRFPDTVELPHSDHSHLFADATAVRMAEAAGRNNCENWPQIPNHRALTFASLESFDFDFLSPESPRAHWATGLIEDGAVAISIRANIEPAKVTREELRRQRKRYMDDVNERQKQGKMDRSEQQDMIETLRAVEEVYGTNGGSPTLVDASVLVAFDGHVEDITQVGLGSAANLRVMNFRQRQALAEMMLCSYVRSNPNLQDLPSQTVACSGIQSLSTVGDKTGAVIGFTERDRQPAHALPSAPSSEDSLPIFLNVGGTGSGKTQVLLWKATQYVKIPGPTGRPSPQIIVDPKSGSDHSPTVLAAGGQVLSLDKLSQSDGIFDPLRFSRNPEVGVDLAVSMLASINPWGASKAEMEVPAFTALKYGVDRGAKCIGQALKIAYQAGRASKELVKPVIDLANASPMFRACVGMEPESEALAIFDGITLIKVGNSHLDLPEPGAIGEATIMQKVSLALVRMMVFGSAMALTGRGGSIHLDEAWVFLGAGKAEVERLGRLARSQGVQPELYTQRVSDALKADLTGYISRGLILPIEDANEAAAACKLFKLEPTPERMARITAKATVGDGESVAPNWNSMKALRDPRTKKVLRGSIAIYADLAGRAVPVQVVLPPSFLKLSSTTPEDVQRREAEMEAKRKAERALEPIPV